MFAIKIGSVPLLLVSVSLMLIPSLRPRLMAVSEPQSLVQHSNQASVNVNDPRPLAAAIQVLENRYGWVITYEDPPYVHPSEISDVTLAVRKDYAPTKPKVLIPLGGSFDFSYPVPSTAGDPDEAGVLATMLDAYRGSGHPGVFGLESSGSVVHIVPLMSRNSQDTLEKRTSLLDTRIDLPARERTAFEMIDGVLTAVTAARGVKVGIGTVPMNALLLTHVQGAVKGETARAALLRTLETTKLKLSWRLLCDPGPAAACAFNVHAVKRTMQ